MTDVMVKTSVVLRWLVFCFFPLHMEEPAVFGGENVWRKQMMIYLFHPEPKAHN